MPRTGSIASNVGPGGDEHALAGEDLRLRPRATAAARSPRAQHAARRRLRRRPGRRCRGRGSSTPSLASCATLRCVGGVAPHLPVHRRRDEQRAVAREAERRRAGRRRGRARAWPGSRPTRARRRSQSAPRERSMWPMPLSAPDAHRSVSTGPARQRLQRDRRDEAAARRRSSRRRRRCRALTNSRVSSAALYAAMPPVMPSTMRAMAAMASIDRRAAEWRRSRRRSLHCVGARPLERASPGHATRRRIDDGRRCASRRPGPRPSGRASGCCARGAAALTDAELARGAARHRDRAARARSTLARDARRRFGGLAGLLAAPVTRGRCASAASGPAKARRARGRRGARAPARCARRPRVRDALTSPQAVRDYLRLLLAARPHEVFVGLFLDSQNRLVARRGALPRHAGADQRLPARGRQGGAGAQRGGGDLRAQPPVRRRRAQPRRRAADAGAEAGAGAGRRPHARPLRRRRRAARVVRGAGVALTEPPRRLAVARMTPAMSERAGLLRALSLDWAGFGL